MRKVRQSRLIKSIKFIQYTINMSPSRSNFSCIILINRKLTAVGVTSAPSQAGYYIFPDFEVCRNSLNKKGITTGQQMCREIMDTKNVAVSTMIQSKNVIKFKINIKFLINLYAVFQ